MITDISTEFKEKIHEYMYNYIPKAELLVMNNDESVKETITLGTKKLMSDGISYSQGTSSTDSFDVGAAVIGSAQIVVDNTGDWLSKYNLENMKCVLYAGLEMDDRTIEYTKKGVFNMENPQTKSTTVTLSMLDNMSLLEKPLKNANIQWPVTSGYALKKICDYCGLALDTQTFSNSEVLINEPEDDITCLDAVSYIAQIACCFAKCNKEGHLELKWYKKIPSNLDGGLLEDYATGDAAFGGTLEDYATGDTFDGGNYGDLSTYHHFYMLKDTPTVYANNTVISGCRIGYGDDNVLSYGTEGYVIEITDNPFITTTEIAQAVVAAIMDKAVGMIFRKCNFTAMYDPTVEAGDVGYISDYAGRTYPIIISNITATLGGKMTISSDSKTASRQSAATKATTQNLIKSAVKKEKDAREKAVEKLAQDLATSSGMFTTDVTTEDGGTIRYVHDKKLLSDSTIVIKITIKAIGISNDGGKTYPYGLDVSGNAILNDIYAIGLNASYITAGIIEGIKIIMQSGSVGGWNINGRALLKEVSYGGNSYCVYLQPPLENNPEKTWVLSCQKNSIGQFILYGDGSTKLGDVYTSKDQVEIITGSKTGIINANGAIFETSTSGVISVYSGDRCRINGDFSVSGTKNRIVETKNYGERLLNAYETPSPLFGDVGDGIIDETGICIISLEDIFSETIDLDNMYQVFLQPYGDGFCYIKERNKYFFTVAGSSGLRFGWHIMAHQVGFNLYRNEKYEEETKRENIIGMLEETIPDNINIERLLEENEE